MDTISRYEAAQRFEPTVHTTDSETFAVAKRVGRAPTPAPVAAECGSGWYHDAAIKDAQEMHGHAYSM